MEEHLNKRIHPDHPDHPDHPNHQNDEQMTRLSTLEGQIRGIRRMISDGRCGVEFVTQIHSARAGLKRVSDLTIEQELSTWTRSVRANQVDKERIDEIFVALRRFSG